MEILGFHKIGVIKLTNKSNGKGLAYGNNIFPLLFTFIFSSIIIPCYTSGKVSYTIMSCLWTESLSCTI